MGKILKEDLKDMCFVIRTKGHALINNGRDNTPVDEDLVKKDIETLKQLSPAMQEELNYGEKHIHNVHRDYNYYNKTRKRVKTGYELRSEIEEKFQTEKDLKKIVSSIDPLTEE